MADIQDSTDEQDQLLNPWIPQGDGEDEIYGDDDELSTVPASVGSSSSSSILTGSLATTTRVKRHQFLGGVEDDDQRMLEFVKNLEIDIEIVKREALIREASLPIIDEPYSDRDRSVAECKFHSWGSNEAVAYYQRTIAPLVDSREKVWYAYRAEIIDPKTNRLEAWFIGATNYVQDDMVRILKKMITGKSARRVNDGEKTPEFNRYTLLEQVGHSWYRRAYNLDFFRVTILAEESKELNQTRSFSMHDQLQIEARTISAHKGWVQNEMVAQGRCGLNYYNPFTRTIPLKWGISLFHLRQLLDEGDFRCRNWTVMDVYERTMKPRAGTLSYVEYLRRTQPMHVSEEADWFLSPGCYNCIWSRVVFGGGIPIYAQDPRPIVKGNRYVFAELFLR